MLSRLDQEKEQHQEARGLKTKSREGKQCW